MNALLLSCILLLIQGIPLPSQQNGTITGVLKDGAGRPAAGVRIAAVPRPDSAEDLIAGTAAMNSIAETDEQGRYTLENVPPGRYFVSAGNLNLPTYYPGTQALAEGKMIAVAAGEKITAIDFTLKDSSAGRAIGAGQPSTFTIPLNLLVENGAKVPRFGGGKVTGVRLTSTTSGGSVFAPVTQPYFQLGVGTANYEIIIEGLPEGYTVKSVKYGSTDINDARLRLTPAPAGTPPGQTISVFSGPFSTTVTLGAATATVQTLISSLQGTPVQMPLPQTLSITLARAPNPTRSGVSVSGQFPPDVRGAFLSGRSFAIYTDDSFEFFGVEPGRYSLMAFGNAQKAYGASLVIGNQDVRDLEVDETSALPLNARISTPPGAIANRPPGRLPLAAVRGKIADVENGDLLTRGDVFLVGDNWVGHPLRDDGKFEFEKLLPGKYAIEVKAQGYPTFRREFEIEDQDIELDLKSN
jgi:hypothetical protein